MDVDEKDVNAVLGKLIRKVDKAAKMDEQEKEPIYILLKKFCQSVLTNKIFFEEVYE